MSTISTGLAKTGIWLLAAGVLVLAATACSGGGGSKPAAPAERHLVYVAGPPEATESATAAKASVWIADPNGAHPRRLTKGFVALISPDGRTVAVQRQGQGIYLVSSDGKQTTRLTASPDLRPQAWASDDSTLYVTKANSQAVTELDAIDRNSGKLQTIARGSLYGVDASPNSKQIVYSRAPVATDQGICGDQFDLYVADLDGSNTKRITDDGLSAFPVWGAGGIAFTHFPVDEQGVPECGASGIATVQPDGSKGKIVVDRAPDSITLLGFYGFQPLGWLGTGKLLVGLRGESGTQGAVLDLATHKVRQLHEFANEASSDGRFSLGDSGDENSISIVRVADGQHVFKRKGACCPDWNR